MNTRFLTFLKIYSINSIFLNLNDAIVLILYLSMNSQVWQFRYTEFYSNPPFIFYYVYIYLPLWSVTYTFAGKTKTSVKNKAFEFIKFFLDFLQAP